MITFSGIQILVLILVMAGVPVISYLWFLKSKAGVLSIATGLSDNRRRLIEEEAFETNEIKLINWSVISSGWKKGKKVDFEGQHIPLIAVLSNHRTPGSWNQANKIGADELIRNCKNYIQKFGPSTFTVAAVSDQDSASNITWGLAKYLTSESSQTLVFEIGTHSKREEESTVIELGNKNFEELPDPRKSQIENVDIINFNSAYNWPEDILKDELINHFCEFYKKKYEVILITAPPILVNGFARKTAKASDCFILATDENDDAADLQDAYLRLKHTCKAAQNESLVIWGVLEK
ncbi:MAG: hypothetical protein COA79_08660 [Planctomycetota bacterium]|nr:MAG: hypothetical protein COA79_08660 [Planctomycetota bacterium]